MNMKGHLLAWLAAILLLCLFLIKVQDILLPFVVAGVVAYFLDPAADRLEKLGLSRLNATLFIIGLFFFICILIGILLVPFLYEQVLLFTKKVPEYTTLVRTRLLPSLLHLVDRINPEAATRIQEAIGNLSGVIFSAAGEFLTNLLKSGLAILNILSLIFITPIITFYILRDWDRIVKKIDSWLPRRHLDVIRQQMCQIDLTLSGYIRGQTNVCILMGLFYGIGLSLAGLEFGFFVGFGTGLLCFIPYAGFGIGFVIGISIAFFQFGLTTELFIVLGVFMVGQILESNFITPKLVGDKVGLHPAWLLFGMMAGAALFGFAGVLIAVPVTAIIAIAVRFLLEKYLQSSLYAPLPSPRTQNQSVDKGNF